MAWPSFKRRRALLKEAGREWVIVIVERRVLNGTGEKSQAEGIIEECTAHER